MKIRKALKKAKRQGGTISSQQAEMFLQTPKTIMHWLIKDPEMSTSYKLRVLEQILTANDWEVDEKECDCD